MINFPSVCCFKFFFFQGKLSTELRKTIMHPYSGCRENPFHFKLRPPVTSTREVELPWELRSCAQVKCFFLTLVWGPAYTDSPYSCAGDAGAVLVTLVTLFIYFFPIIRVHSFHMGRIIVLEVHCFVFCCSVWTLFNIRF